MGEQKVIPFLKLKKSGELDFDLIYAENHRKVYSLALRMTGNEQDAYDALQETFLRVHGGLKRFRGDCAISTWIHSIAANVCRDALEKKKADPLPLLDGFDVVDSAVNFAQKVEDREFIEKLLLHLPEDQRICLLLSDYLGHSYEGISTALSIPVGTVKSRIFRARKSLIEFMEPKGNEKGQN